MFSSLVKAFHDAHNHVYQQATGRSVIIPVNDKSAQELCEAVMAHYGVSEVKGLMKVPGAKGIGLASTPNGVGIMVQLPL